MSLHQPLAPQVTAEHYAWSAYGERGRWSSYWHQIDEALRARPRTCLIVGKGDGTVLDALQREGVQVWTCDIAADLQPSTVADVRQLPFVADAFDVVLCCEVLEHLPFEFLPASLAELRRVARETVVLSLPQQGLSWEIVLHLFPLPRIQLSGKIPLFRRHDFDGEHYWELGARNSPRSVVESKLRAVFGGVRQYQVPDNPYHRFYILNANGLNANGSR